MHGPEAVACDTVLGCLTIPVWDGSHARIEAVAQVAAAQGYRVVPVKSLADLQELTPTVALVAIDDECASGGCSLGFIRAFSNAGYRVIAYGPGVENWPLGRSVKPCLLALRRF